MRQSHQITQVFIKFLYKKGNKNMTKRIISLVLVFVMLFAICITTASCAQLEAFVGEENLGEDYMNKYYPDRNNLPFAWEVLLL